MHISYAFDKCFIGKSESKIKFVTAGLLNMKLETDPKNQGSFERIYSTG